MRQFLKLFKKTLFFLKSFKNHTNINCIKLSFPCVLFENILRVEKDLKSGEV